MNAYDWIAIVFSLVLLGLFLVLFFKQTIVKNLYVRIFIAVVFVFTIVFDVVWLFSVYEPNSSEDWLLVFLPLIITLGLLVLAIKDRENMHLLASQFQVGFKFVLIAMINHALAIVETGSKYPIFFASALYLAPIVGYVEEVRGFDWHTFTREEWDKG